MLNEIMAIGQTFDVVPHAIALVVAYVLALPIGWDREREERSAGLRTFPLVAIASCGFVQAAETVLKGQPEATARVIEGLITGMGFIGGGAILRLKDSVRGTATAASLWATGAVGTAVGLPTSHPEHGSEKLGAIRSRRLRHRSPALVGDLRHAEGPDPPETGVSRPG